MINSLQTMVYKAFGFTIFSEISLPEIPHHNLETGLADIIIKKQISLSWCLNDQV